MSDFEKWKSCVSHPDYMVSSLGNIKSNRTEKNLKLCKTANGYLRVNLYGNGSKKTKSVASVVLEAFIGPRPAGYQAAHLNGNKTDNRVENLRWCTQIENEAHKVWHGTKAECERHGSAKFSDEEAMAIRFLVSKGASISELAIACGVHKETIRAIANETRWALTQTREPLLREVVKAQNDLEISVPVWEDGRFSYVGFQIDKDTLKQFDEAIKKYRESK